MENLFSTLSHAVEGAPLVALGAACLRGVLSVILSPCHLSSVLLIVGFISGQGRVTTGRAFGIAAVFAGGILLMIAGVVVVTGAAGRMMGDVGRRGNYLVAWIFFLVGLNLLGVMPLPWFGPGRAGIKTQGAAGGVCAGARLWNSAGTLHVCLHDTGSRGGVQNGDHSGGLQCGAAAALRRGPLRSHCRGGHIHGTFLKWNEHSKGLTVLKIVCGILVILGGVWLIYSAP